MMNYGRYQILKEVGKGAMGVVYEARDPNIDRVVALKVLRQDRIATETFVKRFLKEAKVIGRLSHPCIVTVFDVGEDNETIYIAMEFLEGVPLSDLIRDKHLDADKVVQLGTQIAATLEYAHQKGVIHRDVKPNNIIVNPDGQIKITDFGIAHIEDPSATLQTQAGEIMGTPAYMSPEQVQGGHVDSRSDLFSLGIILYELSTGMRPFGGEGKGLATIFNEIMLTNPLEPCKECPTIPKGLSRTIMKALEKEPEKRFQSGKELADALQQCLKENEKVVETPIKLPRKKIFGISITTTLTAAMVAGGIYFYSQHKPSKPEPVTPSPPTVSLKAAPVRSAAPAVKTEPAQVKPASLPVKIESATTKTVPVLVKPALPKPAPVTMPPPPILPAVNGEKTDTKPAIKPQKPVTKTIAPLQPLPAPKPLPKFAFLKVHSTPKGAKVFINGTLKGVTPLNLKMGMGEYRVRLSRPGYRDSESNVKIEKMTEYPLTEKLKPEK